MQLRSGDNPLVRRLKRLADSPRACRSTGRTLLEGIHLAQAAAETAVPVRTIVLRAGAGTEAQELAAHVAASQRLQPVILSASLYDAIAPVQHGVGLLVEIDYLLQPAPDALSGDAVYLDGVQDPGNVGTLLRTAAAAGIGTVLLGGQCAYAGSPKVMRAAMGAHFALQVHESVAPDELRKRYRGSIVAADAGAGADLYEAEWGAPETMWLFGGEGKGLSDAAIAQAHLRLRIPIAAAVESLNVGAAAAVCLFEQRRRRLQSMRAQAH